MQPFTIVAYTFHADIYCPTCVISEMEQDPNYDGWADCSIPPMSTEDNLSEVAHAFGIDRMDESTFDSDAFPKVIFADQIDGHIGCGRCARYLG